MPEKIDISKILNDPYKHGLFEFGPSGGRINKDFPFKPAIESFLKRKDISTKQRRWAKEKYNIILLMEELKKRGDI